MLAKVGRTRATFIAGGIVILTFAALLAGAAFGRGHSTEGRAMIARTEGGTPEQQALLREILRGIPRSHIKEVALVAPPEDFEPQDATWISFDVSAADPVANVRGFWQALLVAGLFRDESAKRGLPFVSGKTITVHAPDGTVRDEGSSLIDQPLEHAIQPVSEGQLTNAARAGAGRAGVVLSQVAFAHPLGRLGVEMQVRTSNSAEFIRDRPKKLGQMISALIDPNQPQAEGTFVEVRDENGKFVSVSAYSVRTGEGLGYTDSSLQQGSTLGMSLG